MKQKLKITGRADFVRNVCCKIAVMIVCTAAIWISFFGTIIMAQEQGEWSSPYLLADSDGFPSEALMVSDTYGFLHIFWIEKAVDDEIALIQYVRFDGTEFTTPLDIYATRIPVGGSGVSYIAPYVDQDNQIHLFWTEGNRGPAYYSTAPAHNTLSAHNWSEPVEISLPIFQLRPVVDSQNRLHLLYSDFWGPKPGVFHTFSEDGGKTWSESAWLDPDIPTGQAPKTIHLTIDDQDGLHAVWAYLLLENAIGQSVRYARTLPDGEWALPIEIDEPDESESELRLSEPNIIAQGSNIHIVWAGTENTNREYRFSTDYGQNWSVPIRIFGDLGGQAIGDGLALDGLNRVHFMGQIRYPQAIHHAIWEDGFWSNTDPIYLINPDLENDIG
ncbi:MAG: hypothetical protein R3264_10325, partial [Anaerolineae bacterium]|nr:hypothetical protein [Anaerolineae bacterium]